MSGTETIDASRLKNSMFFRQMPGKHLDQLAEICREVELPAQKTIFEEYDRAKDVYIILSGEVSLVICEPKDACRQISVVGEGDLVGWSPLVGRSRLTDTAVTLTPVKALVFEGKKLLDFCQQHPDFGFTFMQRAATELAKRLSGTRIQLLQMCGNRFPLFTVQPETD
jgi:CRP-like cAMP-binding protein